MSARLALYFLDREASMLSEYKEVRQRDDEGYRRWFSDSYFDIVLWFDRSGGAMTGFQVCYDKGKSERAFTRKDEERLVQSHRYVANGPVAIGSSKMSSVLKGDAGAIDPRVIERLKAEAGDLDAALLGPIVDAMSLYAAR
jgi:hypothetical protein